VSACTKTKQKLIQTRTTIEKIIRVSVVTVIRDETRRNETEMNKVIKQMIKRLSFRFG
jgi:hypothetical protein